MPERLLALRDARRQGIVRGLVSVCSAHPLVLRAAMDQARADGTPLLVETTCNQVNHLGGYTGMTPGIFRDFVRDLAAQADLPPGQILLGGDHLGPGPWRHEAPDLAMATAADMVDSYVAAGFRKIHLATAVPCAGEPRLLSEQVAAQRTAALCARAEAAYALEPAGQPPVYVVGTEGPAAGGARSEDPKVVISTPEAVERTLDLLQDAFAREGVGDAWDRVVALVVQPGVQFSETAVHPYDRKRARALAGAAGARGPWMFEAHATDYQHPRALAELVEDGFGILKVGPWLTFACREALFALEDIAKEARRLDGEPPHIELREVLDRAMRRNPVHWKDHHRGSPGEQSYARLFSYSDRSRHYWTDPEVEAEVDRLLEVTAGPLPRQLLSQHLPQALEAILDGDLEPSGHAIVLHAIRRVLGHYAAACRVRV